MRPRRTDARVNHIPEDYGTSLWALTHPWTVDGRLDQLDRGANPASLLR